MFESLTAAEVPRSGSVEPAGDGSGRPAAPRTAGPELPRAITGTAGLGAVLEGLGRLSVAEAETESIERIRGLEELKVGCAVVQAREAVALDGLRRAAEAEQGVPARARGRALVTEMAHTMAALAAGRIWEWQATVVCRESAWLQVEHRREGR